MCEYERILNQLLADPNFDNSSSLKVLTDDELVLLKNEIESNCGKKPITKERRELNKALLKRLHYLPGEEEIIHVLRSEKFLQILKNILMFGMPMIIAFMSLGIHSATTEILSALTGVGGFCGIIWGGGTYYSFIQEMNRIENDKKFKNFLLAIILEINSRYHENLKSSLDQHLSSYEPDEEGDLQLYAEPVEGEGNIRRLPNLNPIYSGLIKYGVFLSKQDQKDYELVWQSKIRKLVKPFSQSSYVKYLSYLVNGTEEKNIINWAATGEKQTKLNFRDYWRTSKSNLIRKAFEESAAGLSTFALSGMLLIVIKSMGIASVAGFLCGPIGMGIIGGSALLFVCLVWAISIYDSYNKAMRDHLMELTTIALDEQKKITEQYQKAIESLKEIKLPTAASTRPSQEDGSSFSQIFASLDPSHDSQPSPKTPSASPHESDHEDETTHLRTGQLSSMFPTGQQTAGAVIPPAINSSATASLSSSQHP